MIVAADRGRMVLTDVFGFPDDPGVDVRVVIRKYGLAEAFYRDGSGRSRGDRRAALATAEGRADYRELDDVHHRRRDMPRISTTRSASRRSTTAGLLLGVHIADVSHYVRPGTALDRSAYDRGTSVYFPGPDPADAPRAAVERRLQPPAARRPADVSRPCWRSTPDGSVVRAEFHPSIIRTAERLTYTSVFKIFEGDADERPTLCRPRPRPPGHARAGAAAPGAGASTREAWISTSSSPSSSIRKAGSPRSRPSPRTRPTSSSRSSWSRPTWPSPPTSPGRKDSLDLPRPPRARGRRPGKAPRDAAALSGSSFPTPDKIRPADLQAAIRAAEGRPAEQVRQRPGPAGDAAGRLFRARTSAITAWPSQTTRISLRPSAAIPTSSSTVRSSGRSRFDAVPALPGIALHSSEQERKADGAEQDLVEWRIFRFLKDKLGEEFTGSSSTSPGPGSSSSSTIYFVRGHLSFDDLGAATGSPRPGARSGPPGRKPRPRIELGQSVTVVLAAVDPILRRMTLVPA